MKLPRPEGTLEMNFSAFRKNGIARRDVPRDPPATRTSLTFSASPSRYGGAHCRRLVAVRCIQRKLLAPNA